MKVKGNVHPFLSLEYDNLFQGDIFMYDYLNKEVLIRHIENFHKGKCILRTKLLYKLDKYNIVNFHTYIDYRTRIVMVVKTNNAMVAGYYPGFLSDTEVMDEDGIIIQINKDASYELDRSNREKKPKTVVYDSYYMIFGNA